MMIPNDYDIFGRWLGGLNNTNQQRDSQKGGLFKKIYDTNLILLFLKELAESTRQSESSFLIVIQQ